MLLETLLVGLVLALLWAELTDVSPGGIIVPGYFALYLDRPLRGLATIATAILCLLIYRLLSRYLVLFGRRRFVLLVLFGAALAQIWLLLFPRLFHSPLELQVIGWVIPGLLASNLQRQRFLPTLSSLVTVSVLTFAIVRLAALL